MVLGIAALIMKKVPVNGPTDILYPFANDCNAV